ncbi:TCR-alpha V segment I-33 according to annotation by Tatsuya Ota [Triplophysa rosa]|nr:TCR-alpha V segment I-33 according to annotation by Tatsuya Ota [Triplophysa rosa]
MDVHTVILFCALAYVVSGTAITADEEEISAEEDSHVTLSCSYTSNDYLYWYRQYPGSAPEFLLRIYDGTTNDKKSDVDPRMSVKLTQQKQKQVHLEISSVSLSDSDLKHVHTLDKTNSYCFHIFHGNQITGRC